MTWEATIEHENCPSVSVYGEQRSRDKQSGFEDAALAMLWVCSRLRQHTTNIYSAPTTTLTIAVTIKETCLHDKQAKWVKAARRFLADTGLFNNYATDLPTYPAYNEVSQLLKHLSTCARCGEAVE